MNLCRWTKHEMQLHAQIIHKAHQTKLWWHCKGLEILRNGFHMQIDICTSQLSSTILCPPSFSLLGLKESQVLIENIYHHVDNHEITLQLLKIFVIGDHQNKSTNQCLYSPKAQKKYEVLLACWSNTKTCWRCLFVAISMHPFTWPTTLRGLLADLARWKIEAEIA